MATTSLTLNNELLASTLYVLNKEETDLLFETTPLFDHQKKAHGGEGKPSYPGGSTIIEPLVVDEHSDATQLSTGYEAINLSVREVLKPAQFDWFEAVVPIVISGSEERKNRGPQAVLQILEARHAAAMGGFRRNFCQQIIAGNVASMSNLNTLNGVDYTGASGGFLEEDAVGSQANSVGGVSKSTYSSLVGWQNQRATASGSFNANGLAAFDDVNVEMRQYSPSGPPSVGLVSKSAFKNLKRALRAYERYVNEKTLDGGRMMLEWDGAPLEVEVNMPNAGTNTSANPISAYFLNLDHIKVAWHEQGFFEVGDFREQSGYDVRAAHILVMCQLTANHLGSSGIVYNADTF